MKHEDILGCSVDALEKMKDSELLEWYTPMLKITRPELAEKPKTNAQRRVQEPKGPKSSRAKEILSQMGIDFSK